MRRTDIRNLSKTARRGAFSLIELLVVIAIIAALMALSAAAVIKFLGSQQVANTRSTLDRTQSQLNKAWSKVKDQANREEIPPAINTWIMTNLAGNDPNAQGRARVIYVKLKLRQAFPMNFNEALNPTPLPALPSYTAYLKGKMGITGSSGAVYESSACVLMALERGVSGAGVDVSDLTKGGASGTVVAPSGANLPFLADAWNHPLFFSRVPAGNLYLNPSTPTSTANPYPLSGGIICYSQPGANDPGDPQGYLQMAAWGATFGSTYSALTLQVLAKGNTSYKLAPMLASAGMDGARQFDPITFAPTTLGTDDLFSTPEK
jgi:prepilin-type N-terminal cleavage/methylation domain-containing protein